MIAGGFPQSPAGSLCYPQYVHTYLSCTLSPNAPCPGVLVGGGAPVPNKTCDSALSSPNRSNSLKVPKSVFPRSLIFPFFGPFSKHSQRSRELKYNCGTGLLDKELLLIDTETSSVT